MPLDPPSIRHHFAVFRQAHPPIYLDSAATAQVPNVVLNAMNRYYREYCSNVHRGMHAMTERATSAYEEARKTVRHFINAEHPAEIIFTGSATQAINLVAKTIGRHWNERDAVVLSLLEHHSAVVPWLQLKEERGVDVEWIDIEDNGQLKLEQLDRHLVKGNVKLVSITGQSNVLGVRPDLNSIIAKAHSAGALVLVDAAQLVVHHPIDVQALDCDFLVLGGHKLYGPTGVGVLYGKREYLESMQPWLGGGGMIQEVHRDHYTPADIPQKFEAGTPPIAEAIGLKAAIEWLQQFDWKDIETHEESLLRHAAHALSSIKDLRLLGTSYEIRNTKYEIRNSGCLSFILDGVHPHDLTDILGKQNIHLRAGHHCTQPLHQRLGITASTRLSIGIYNEEAEIDALACAIGNVLQSLGVASRRQRIRST